jgi:hypothetical protein
MPEAKSNISIYDRITKDVGNYKIDTTSPPNDKATSLIRKIQNSKGGFNIHEAISFKLEEDRQKKDLTENQYNQLSQYLKNGNGKLWLDNAVAWIFRKNFNTKELKNLLRFYSSTTGQKMSELFPVIMLQSLMAAQFLKEQIVPENKK